MSGQRSLSASASQWECQPEAWTFLRNMLRQFCDQSEYLAAWRDRLLNETGTRLVDWIDHLTLGSAAVSDKDLAKLGFCPEQTVSVWRHPKGLFPAIRRPVSNGEEGVAMKVQSVDDFCQLHDMQDAADAAATADLRLVAVQKTPEVTFWIVERHGNAGFEPREATDAQRQMLERGAQLFRNRTRIENRTGFDLAQQIFDAVAVELGRNWACDLFFASERAYWQSRNHAAQIQKQRQDALGLGWANHDHHTYRCSREHFASLISVLEHFGFACRERFYAGAQAGWGAQVLEQTECGLVIFADVDLSPDEVAGDFAHQGLAARKELGTVGLWCKLHGESFLTAGMHHLECQFEFDAAREQLAAVGVATMDPFTDFPFLRQAFTEGERWSIDPAHLEQLTQQRWLSAEQAASFTQKGAIGSHLEILERNQGYKGFNQTGVSDIIQRTDPRLQSLD